MEFINILPALILNIGGLIVAVAAAGLIRKIAAFVEKIQL